MGYEVINLLQKREAHRRAELRYTPGLSQAVAARQMLSEELAHLKLDIRNIFFSFLVKPVCGFLQTRLAAARVFLQNRTRVRKVPESLEQTTGGAHKCVRPVSCRVS